MISNQKKINHLLWRAGFGPSWNQQNEFQSTDHAVEQLFSGGNAKPINTVSVPQQMGGEGMMGMAQQRQMMMQRREQQQMTTEQRKEKRMEKHEEIRTMTSAWLQNMYGDKNLLQEKMSLFWHGAITCHSEIPLFAQQYVNIIRANSLGKFGDLLRNVSKSPAMMMYLDTMKNRKGSPNENFARELMELFTIGKGNYTEQDVKEGARAFTGWSLKPPEGFWVNESEHDDGQKIFFGKKGNLSGDDVLDIILADKRTAKNISRKIYRCFVNDQVNDEIVNDLSEKFYQSDYHIGKLMKEIFSSDWFYAEENIGAHVKSPVELIAGITRQMNLQYENEDALHVPQRILGQELMSPPNVAGWPGGKNWIDSSSLIYRLNFANSILSPNSNGYDVSPKIQPEEMLISNANVRVKVNDPDAVWINYAKNFTADSNQELFEEISEFLIQPPQLSFSMTDILPGESLMGRDEFIQKATLRLLSTPEYQMC